MAEITAEDAAALAAANSGANEAELELIYTAITARATAGHYDHLYLLTNPATKSAVIAKLTTDLGHTVTVLEDGITLRIEWPPAS